MVEATQCKSQAPTPTGGRSSNMKVNTSSIGTIQRLLMSQEERILKDKQFGSGASTVEPTRDGRLSILTKLMTSPRKELMKSSDSTSIDHSTLFQDSQ